ncbi:MAG: hypothetical protein HRU20_22310 [Pseudomonadales bacterium]|nr:hypothetical protein [Pseudomonadales bacterium]
MRDITFCLILTLYLLSGAGCSPIEYRVYDSVYHYQYKTDKELYGVDDYWPTTQQFKALKQGDCDAYAGYFSEQLNVPVTIGTIRHRDGHYEGHAWVVSGDYIVDNLGVHSRDDSRYKPIYSIPNWQQAALIQQASLKRGAKAKEYFSRQLSPYVSLAY